MGVSLLEGWLHIVVIVLGVASAAYLLIRPFRWWSWVVPPVLVGSAMAAWAIWQFVARITSASN